MAGCNLVDSEETLDDLGRQGYRVIQARKGYRFSMDAVLLADFACPKAGDRVLDLGTGCGVVALLMAVRQPECSITGLEIQPALADRARRSVDLNRLHNRVRIIVGDLRNISSFFVRPDFDLVVFNPPFFRAGEGLPSQDIEKLIARHEVKATLADFVSAAAGVLVRGGRMAGILRVDRLPEFIELSREQKLRVSRLRFVHPRAGEDANLVLVEAKKGRRVKLQVMPPLVVYGDSGDYTPEILRIYGAGEAD